jgi:alpha-tubulin suppressor-like RCC1 family protein
MVINVCDAESGFFNEKTIFSSRKVKEKDILILKIDAGDTFSIGLTSDGHILGWGSGFYGELPPTTSLVEQFRYIPLPEKIENISCGMNHVLVVSIQGQVYGWGWNSNGQVGIPTETEIIDQPTKLFFGSEKSIQIQSVAAGGRHSLAIDTKGTVWSWGDNQYGQLGHQSSTKNDPLPNVVEMTKQIPMIQIATGYAHSAMISRDKGDLYTFGWGQYHQLGHGNNTNQVLPMQVTYFDGVSRLSKVSCGAWHTCVITEQGDLYSWGWNKHGQLGISVEKETQVFPFSIETIGMKEDGSKDAKDVSCGTKHTVVLLCDETVVIFGQTTTQTLQQIKQIATGTHHTLLL